MTEDNYRCHLCHCLINVDGAPSLEQHKKEFHPVCPICHEPMGRERSGDFSCSNMTCIETEIAQKQRLQREFEKLTNKCTNRLTKRPYLVIKGADRGGIGFLGGW